MDQAHRGRDAAWHRNMRNGRERDGLVEDPEQTEEPGQVEETGQGDETGYGGEPGHVEDPEQLGQGDEPGQVEEPELLERLLQVSDDDAPAHALVDSEIIRDRDQGPWEFLVEQPYHRACIIQSMEHDPRCGNCRTLVELDVEDGEAIIVKHVSPPPKCRVCGDAITGIVLEGPQCDHQFDYRCLVDYYAQF
ncbi:hypothetical protein F441_09790 [Phytophthora nicotianae CJ01A1]|uniref:Uncharacterized protein n=1 Tax=Phytophthora nicotianae CJ01A1 TaxID=1317063 RepID=W2WYR0_PHYNI|nr:hypothetical protein F441_09790 [Phytophthora nicotianae CJ01A1]